MPDQVKYTSKLRDKRVLIIGGSSGVGYAVAEAVLEQSGMVIVSSSNPTRVEDAVKSLNSAYPSAKDRLRGLTCDMGTESTVEDNIRRLFDHAGQLDHIVFTAGEFIPPTPLAEATVEAIRSAATTRYIGAIMVSKHAPSYLAKSPESSITLTTGIVTEKPIPGWSVIAGARSAVVGLGKALALDLKPIRVNVVSLGAVDTNTWSGVSAEQKETIFRELAAKTTTGRIPQASDVADAYVYCMKDRNVTGSVISTSGGALLV